MDLEQEFIDLCRHGDLEECKRFYVANPGINISAENEYAYRIACFWGYTYIIKWLQMIKPCTDVKALCDNAIFNTNSDIHKLLMHYIPFCDLYEQRWTFVMFFDLV